MQNRCALQLVASDPHVFRGAAEVLGAADYRIVNRDVVAGTVPDLIIVHVADTMTWSNSAVAPVLIVDLSLLRGDDLICLVERVTGRPDIRLLRRRESVGGSYRVRPNERTCE